MEMNGREGPEERDEPASCESEADRGEQEGPEQAVQQDVMVAAVECWIAVAQKASRRIDDSAEPIEIRRQTGPRDDGSVSLLKAGDLGQGPRGDEMRDGVHAQACKPDSPSSRTMDLV